MKNDIKKYINEFYKLYIEGCASGEMLLEKILEEDSSFADDSRHSNCGSFQSDKRQLIANGSSNAHHHYTGSVHVTNI